MDTDRRTRFRDYMRRLDPTGDPVQAIASGFYVAPPNAVSQRIATRLELEPTSSHLLIGGIGSGKTTELIAIEQKLAAVEDVFPVRVDVPSRHRLDKLKPGVLIALAAIEACAELNRQIEMGLKVDEEIQQAQRRISFITKGSYEFFPPGEDEEPGFWHPGVLEEPEISKQVTSLSEELKQVTSLLRRKPILLFDGLDRVIDLAAFASVVTQDVPLLSNADVGLVMIGPQNLRFSPQRFIEQSFETVHLHGAVAMDTDNGKGFLTSVLRARADESILPQASADAIIHWSGGVLRDLVALARAAGAEAYADGADMIQDAHVSTAADRFGRDLLLGCTKEMVDRLKELVPRKPGRGFPLIQPTITIATEVDQRLLMERLLIEVPGTPVRYVLHPTIVPLLPGVVGS